MSVLQHDVDHGLAKAFSLASPAFEPRDPELFWLHLTCPEKAYDHWKFRIGRVRCACSAFMSLKIFVRLNSADPESKEKDIAKYFVPASKIRACAVRAGTGGQ
jgi:hypothetical protein